MRKPKKPDRRAEARRRADKLAEQLEAHRRDRTAFATSLGMGPVSFDNNMARRHGWTNSEIVAFWDATATLYKKTSNKHHRRHPELYEKRGGVWVYIGPDDNGHTLTRLTKAT